MVARFRHPRNRGILLVTHHFAPETGAPQRRWEALASHLVPAGYPVTVLTPPPHYPSGKITHFSPAFLAGSVTQRIHGEKIIRVNCREHSQDLGSRGADQVVAAVSGTARLLGTAEEHVVAEVSRLLTNDFTAVTAEGGA